MQKSIFVTKGCLRLFYTDELGKEHIIYFMPKDWWAADIAQKPANYNIEALEDCEVLELTYKDQKKLYECVQKLSVSSEYLRKMDLFSTSVESFKIYLKLRKNDTNNLEKNIQS